jgi:hypothetical protein
VYEVGIEEHSFGNGSFSRIDMGDNPNVANGLQIA